MWPNQQFPADLVTFTWEILNGKLHFLCSKVWKLGSALAKKKSFLTGIGYMAVLKVVNLQIFGVKSDLVFPNGSFSVYFVELALRKKRISEHYCCKYKRCHSGFSFSWLSPFIYCISRSSHRRCSVKKVFLKISQISQESTCVRVSF